MNTARPAGHRCAGDRLVGLPRVGRPRVVPQNARRRRVGRPGVRQHRVRQHRVRQHRACHQELGVPERRSRSAESRGRCHPENPRSGRRRRHSVDQTDRHVRVGARGTPNAYRREPHRGPVGRSRGGHRERRPGRLPSAYGRRDAATPCVAVAPCRMTEAQWPPTVLGRAGHGTGGQWAAPDRFEADPSWTAAGSRRADDRGRADRQAGGTPRGKVGPLRHGRDMTSRRSRRTVGHPFDQNHFDQSWADRSWADPGGDGPLPAETDPRTNGSRRVEDARSTAAVPRRAGWQRRQCRRTARLPVAAGRSRDDPPHAAAGPNRNDPPHARPSE